MLEHLNFIDLLSCYVMHLYVNICVVYKCNRGSANCEPSHFFSKIFTFFMRNSSRKIKFVWNWWAKIQSDYILLLTIFAIISKSISTEDHEIERERKCMRDSHFLFLRKIDKVRERNEIMGNFIAHNEIIIFCWTHC